MPFEELKIKIRTSTELIQELEDQNLRGINFYYH